MKSPLFWIFSCVSAVAALVDADFLVTDTKVRDIPPTHKPAYLNSYRDPTFGTRVIRITGNPDSAIPNVDGRWAQVARHHYSKDAAWNCDQSLLCLTRHHGCPSRLFLDGSTYVPLFGRHRSPGAEIRWHPKRPGIMVYVNDNVIGYWDVRENTTRVIATFPGYAEFRIGPWEGNLSLDGRLIVVDGKRGQDRIAFAYDIRRKQKYPDLVLNEVTIDWVSVSASGKYIVLNGEIDGGRDRTQVYDLAGNKTGELWAAYGRPSHYDLTLDKNGDDVAVGVSKSKPDNGRVIKRRLRDGKVSVLTPGGYACHTSTRNVDRPGWAYVTYQYRGAKWLPYRDEVVAVKLDGSMTVERIAHLHTKKIDYVTEAHAVPSPDGKRVLWASNWESTSGRPVSAYVTDTRGKSRVAETR